MIRKLLSARRIYLNPPERVVPRRLESVAIYDAIDGILPVVEHDAGFG